MIGLWVYLLFVAIGSAVDVALAQRAWDDDKKFYAIFFIACAFAQLAVGCVIAWNSGSR